MIRGYGKQGIRQYPNRVLESTNEFGKFGALYDWDANEGITLNGTTVSSWRDKIQGRTWVQSTVGSQPEYSTAIINGQNAVFANNTNKFMTSVIPTTIGDDYWLAWVFLDNNAGAVIGPHNTGSTVNINPTRPVIGNSSLAYIGAFCSSKTNTTTNGRHVVAGSTSNWFVVIFTRTKIFVNGISEPIVGTADYKSQATLNSLFRTTVSVLNTTGYLSRLIIGNQALSDSSLLELSNSINLKYQVY